MLDVSEIATILAFIFFLVVEWPKIQSRGKETMPAFERLLLALSHTITGIAILLMMSVFVLRGIRQILLVSGLLLLGLGWLVAYWVDNRMKRSSATHKSLSVQESAEEREPQAQSLSNREGRITALEPAAIIKRFSSNLEKIKDERIKAGWDITGLGLNFLERVKTAPPFLGLHHDKPLIPASTERALTEFFIARIYMEKYRDSIRGGVKHIVRDGENSRQSIAKAVYGHERYEVYVPAHHSYPTGVVLTLPYINLETPDHPDEIERMVAISEDTESIISLLEPYNLVRREAIPLLRMVYDAAQKTLNEREPIIRAERFVYPTYAKYGAQEAGVTLYNDGTQNLTEVYVTLVTIANKGFDYETGWTETIPIEIKADNHLFDSQEDTIRAEDKTTFILAKVQDNEVILLLKKRPYKLKHRHIHANPTNFHSREEWEIVFDVHGKVEGNHFRERFVVVIESHKIQSFADSALEDSLTLDIKKEIVHL